MYYKNSLSVPDCSKRQLQSCMLIQLSIICMKHEDPTKCVVYTLLQCRIQNFSYMQLLANPVQTI